MLGIVNKDGKLVCNIPWMHCADCRSGLHGYPLECPHGYTKEKLPVLLGDAIAKVATPVARVLGLPCVDKTTGKLKSQSGCAKRRAWLNGLSG